MRKYVLAVAAGVAVVLTTSFDFAAEQMQEPETHIVTITTFYAPLGPERDKLMEFIDTYTVPQTKEDPNVLSFRIGSHQWGGNEPNMWIITEYESLAAIDRSDEWGSEWFDKKYPEGSAARETADKAFEEAFAPYFSTHNDNIISVNMTRAK